MRAKWAVALLLVPLLTRAEDKPADTPKDLPVKATLVAKKTTYPLDFGGKTLDDYKKAIKDGEADLRSLPPAPTVEIVLELKNTSAKDVKIGIGGDPVRINLELKGPGAISVTPRQAFTRIFRPIQTIDLAAGKTHEIKIASLQYGYRGIEKRAYWTEAGEYTLGASLTTAISPAPEGTKPDANGFGPVTLKAEPIKIKVEKK